MSDSSSSSTGVDNSTEVASTDTPWQIFENYYTNSTYFPYAVGVTVVVGIVVLYSLYVLLKLVFDGFTVASRGFVGSDFRTIATDELACQDSSLSTSAVGVEENDEDDEREE